MLALPVLMYSSVRGQTITGFANVEEEYSDQAAGTSVTPWRLEAALQERGANYVQAGLFKPFEICDGRLFTGQQQWRPEPEYRRTPK